MTSSTSGGLRTRTCRFRRTRQISCGPIVGFFGLIERRIDLELLDYLAASRPHWTFLLIGLVALPARELPQRPNLHFIGTRPYESLPAYGKQFDVAIIPYRQTQFDYHANPLKLREYMAMGKPVVAVSTPEINKYADVVNVAHSREEFLSKLDAVVSGPAEAAAVERRIGRVALESWDARLTEVLEIVRRRLDDHPAQLPRSDNNTEPGHLARRASEPVTSSGY